MSASIHQVVIFKARNKTIGTLEKFDLSSGL